MGESKRDTWGGKLDFIMSTLSFAVGMGNLWRFPYLCYRSGGGAFLIPYVIAMVLCGYPLMLLEFTLGQYAGKGIVSVWKACPLFEGIGWGMFCVSVFTGVYYNMIVAWCFFYLFASFASDVPWRDCDNWWNTQACISSDMAKDERNCTSHNGTWLNQTCLWLGDDQRSDFQIVQSNETITRTSPGDEFFNEYMLAVSGGFHELGAPRWQLALCFLLAWLIVFFSLAKGIKVSGKVTYVTALFPYVVLTILLVRGVTLPGSAQGILFYIKPDFSKLLNLRIWGDAAVQAFFSLSICWGGLVSLASYNRFHNNCLRDTLIVATGDMLTSIFAGFVIFAIIGYMAHELGLPLDQVATQGPGLAFVVYPEAVTKMPVSPLWAVLFFLMLINIGIGSQMGLVSTIHVTVLEAFPRLLKPRSILVLAAICGAMYLVALAMTTRGGVYFLLLMDTYSATYALLILALLECVAIGWVYSTPRFYNDLEDMLGRRLSPWWKVCWMVVDPVLIVGIMFFIIYDFRRSSYRDYVFPVHWDVLGWGIAVLPMLLVPVVGLVKLCNRDKGQSLMERLKFLCQPAEDWGPSELREIENKEELQQLQAIHT